ncbi:hypothetical protein [Acinetobacter junii]|uniref:hypothetical protein n=1 Tax=Acinetobacter junii TaxID=40215 RepID=UPI003EDF3017
MKVIKGTLAITLTSLLAACGGNDGYYSKTESTNPPGGQTPPPVSESEQAKAALDNLKKEGSYLFGNYDATDANTPKGYIDHAFDTFAQGPLQLTVDIKKLFDETKAAGTVNNYFTYYANCFGGEGNQIYENTSCYALEGEDKIKAALNVIAPNKYSDWDFKISKDQLENLKIAPDQIKKFTGETFFLIFNNQNQDKAFNDVWTAGVFGYPYQQSWGLTQSKQLRIVSMNGEGQYNVTIPPATEGDEEKTYGALSIYKDPTSLDGDLFVLQNNSSFDVLINDNPNTPDIEPVSFKINSIPGDATALATYRIKSSGVKILNIPSVSAISGNRIENEEPAANTQSFTGSVYFEGNDIFTFKKSLNGTILKFKHIFNNTTYEGESLNSNGTITTKLNTPSGIEF